MKKLLLIYIVLFFLVGCKSKEKKFDDIEIMAYHIICEMQNDTTESNNFKIKCKFYALIDTNGKVKMSFNNSFKGNDFKYIDLQLDKNKINELADSLLKLNAFSILGNSKDLIYDGPSITIRITKGNISKTVNFINHIDSTNAFYVNFYNSIKVLCKSDQNTLNNDSNNLKFRRDDFMNWVFKMDTLNHPLPKILPDEEVSDEPLKPKHPKKHPKKD